MALVLSVVLHALVFLVPIEAWRPVFRLLPGVRSVPIGEAPGPPEVTMIYLAPRRGGRPRSVPAPGQGPSTVSGSSGVPTRGEDRLPAGAVALPTPGARGAEPAPDSSGRPSVGPRYGSGVLWVRPLPFSPAQLAEGLRRNHVQQVDSAVTLIVQAFLDSVAADPSSRGAKLPDWTTQVAGTKFGLDSRYIYLFGLRIPAAVLALLPFPQGNLDQAKADQRLMDMRDDIYRAARRAQTTEDFKQAIKELREEKDRERELLRNQRRPPPPSDSTP